MSKVSRQFMVDPKDVGFVIGSKGKTINLIIERTGAYVNLRKFNAPDTSVEYTYFFIEGTSDQVDAAYKWVKTVAQENYDRRTNPHYKAPERGTTHYPKTIPSSGGGATSYIQQFPNLTGHSGVAPPMPPMPPMPQMLSQSPRDRLVAWRLDHMSPDFIPDPSLGYMPHHHHMMEFMPGHFGAGIQYPMPQMMNFQPVLPPQPDPKEFPNQYQHPPPDDTHHYTDVGVEMDCPFTSSPCGCQIDIHGEIDIPEDKAEQRQILDGLFGTSNVKLSAKCPYCSAPIISLK
jgi:hypothetical protein